MTFTEQINKQRAKNNSVRKFNDRRFADQVYDEFFDDQSDYQILIPKIQSATNELINGLNRIVNADEPTDDYVFNSGENIMLCADRIRELMDSITDRFEM